ncbi:Uncharacterized protein BP5553_07731 [Venustampulla echinocandica]|uniref:2EXR domain-containing protein n=1 Tax=Venustampulla echinocandica TaxID=2656787 RepID=A0A370THD4_9HELO|nr:Uncharacterized protein BP5553_07731 [Venustampulla echinocandica]RDL34603.1 Uncharacterized protein BP5553_07731 [Venustampulla echinocandica]
MSTDSTLTTFHLFPTLPIEIRLKIWSLNLSVPRAITILCNKDFIKGSAPGTVRTAKSWTTDTPSPPLLVVNRESRYEALTVYAPYFTTLSCPRPIYLSFSQDTLKFADGVLPYIPRTYLLEIQKIVLDTKDCAYFGFYHMETLKNMKRLREFAIYGERGAVVRGNDGNRYLHFLITDFEEAIDADPDWEYPTVRIFNGQTGKEERVIEGRAKFPEEEPPEE